MGTPSMVASNGPSTLISARMVNSFHRCVCSQGNARLGPLRISWNATEALVSAPLHKDRNLEVVPFFCAAQGEWLRGRSPSHPGIRQPGGCPRHFCPAVRAVSVNSERIAMDTNLAEAGTPLLRASRVPNHVSYRQVRQNVRALLSVPRAETD